jgi:hypothetical protein
VPTDDATRFHYLEDCATSAIRQLIDARAPEVWSRLRDPLNCLEACAWWLKGLESAQIRAAMHGRVGLSNQGGYVNTNGNTDGHVFIVLGDELALFDPTYAQLLDDPPWALDRYRMEDGQPFPLWRAECRLGTSDGR